MPQANLQKKVAIDKIEMSKGATLMYSDPDAGVKGIRLAVSANEKRWQFVRRVNGKVKAVSFATFPDAPSIHAAAVIRDDMFTKAKQATTAKATGISTPLDAFDDMMKRSSARPKTKDWYRAQINRHLLDLFNMNIDDITPADVRTAVAPFLVKNESGALRASRTYTSLKDIILRTFNHIEVERMMPNPARTLVAPVKRLKPNNRVAFDASGDWPVLDMIDARKGGRSDIDAHGWELMLFTGLRTENAKRLEWADFDEDRALITARRVKGDLDVTFPLSNRAIDVLRALRLRTGHQRWVFPHRNAAKAHLHKSGFGKDLTSDDVRLKPHDMRRLFTTACRSLGFEDYVTEQARGSSSRSVVDLYDQGSLRHEHLERVAEHIENKCRRSTSNSAVVSIHSTA